MIDLSTKTTYSSVRDGYRNLLISMILIASAIVIGLVRLTVTPTKPTLTDVYKDLAHFFVACSFQVLGGLTACIDGYSGLVRA